MQIVPLRFCHIGTKRSVLWPSKYAKIRFCSPGPRWWSSRRSPDRLIGWGGTPLPIPRPLATDPPSTLAMRSPEFQQIYAYGHRQQTLSLLRTSGEQETSTQRCMNGLLSRFWQPSVLRLLNVFTSPEKAANQSSNKTHKSTELRNIQKQTQSMQYQIKYEAQA